MSFGFVQLSRDPKVAELIQQAPLAFLLVTQIAQRARRDATGFNPHNLVTGEALIGDHKSIGLTEQQYRTAKLQLQKWKIATFRATTKGTVAMLCDSTIYNINAEQGNGQGNAPLTDAQRTPNGRLTTKKNGRSKEEDIPDSRFAPVTDGYCEAFGEVFGSPYVHNGGRDGKALKQFLSTAKTEDFPAESIVRVAKAAMKRSLDPFAKVAKFASSLHGFCEQFNAIRAELNAERGSTGTNGHPKPASKKLPSCTDLGRH